MLHTALSYRHYQDDLRYFSAVAGDISGMFNRCVRVINLRYYKRVEEIKPKVLIWTRVVNMADAETETGYSEIENIPMEDIRKLESKTASIETGSVKDETENAHTEQRRKEYDINTDRERLAENNRSMNMPMEGVRTPKRSKRVVACVSVLLVFCLAVASTVGLIVKYQAVPPPSMQNGKTNVSTTKMPMYVYQILPIFIKLIIEARSKLFIITETDM